MEQQFRRSAASRRWFRALGHKYCNNGKPQSATSTAHDARELYFQNEDLKGAIAVLRAAVQAADNPASDQNTVCQALYGRLLTAANDADSLAQRGCGIIARCIVTCRRLAISRPHPSSARIWLPSRGFQPRR
ncbi:MAG: hypothetical protein AAFP90_02065, partial [Planctomycetota bacterium]